MPGMSVHGQLKDAVMPIHRQMEQMAPFVSIMDGSITIGGYRDLIARFYGFVGPMESEMEKGLGIKDAFWRYDEIRRLTHLEEDLRFHGISESERDRLPRCASVPTLQTADGLLGAIYISEGSRLGGRVLAGKLKARFQWEGTRGCTYFDSDGKEVSLLWQRYLAVLKSYSGDSAKEKQIVEAAVGVFLALRDWLDPLGKPA